MRDRGDVGGALSQLYPVERKKPLVEPDAWLAITLITASFAGLY